VRKALAAALIVPLIAAALCSPLAAQTFWGSIQGVVSDNAGRPITGGAVFLSSPSMQGQRITLTGKRGGFDFPSLPAGVYSLSAEMPGYVTLVNDGILLLSGESRFFRIELAPSEEETSVRAEAKWPALDAVSPKDAVRRGRELLERLPLARDFGSILGLMPGTADPGFPYPREAAILGGTSRDNAYLLDGANVTDVFDQTMGLDLNIDLLEEVEVVSAGRPASAPPGGGSVVNIITKSGGDSVSGGLSLHFMSGTFNQDLWTSAEVEEAGTASPGGDRGLIEPSLNLGGTFWPDRAWYFLAGRFMKKTQSGIFIGPYRDTEGRLHENYDWSRRDISGFFKLTVRPIAQGRLALWAHLDGASQPVAEPPSARLPFLSTRVLNHEGSLSLFATGDYEIRPNTTAFVRGAYIRRTIRTELQEEALGLPWTDDAGDLYGPLSGADANAESERQKLQANASVRHFVDGFLGTNHTLGAGVDFEDATTSLNWWRADNLRWYLDSRNPGQAYYGDRGLLGFWLCGTVEGATLVKFKTQTLGAYVTDVFSAGRRLTFNLGLRFDWSRGWFPSSYKFESGNPLSRYIGDALLSPRMASSWPDDFPVGFNPLDQLSYNEQKDLVSWMSLSPRAGFVFDVFGRGRTLLKASYARYTDVLSHRYILPLHPLYPRDLAVTWSDVNGDGRADPEDEFGLFNVDYRMISGMSLDKVVDGGLKAPSTDEFSVGVEHELLRDFTLSVRFVSRVQKNILEDALTVLDTGETWYAAGPSAAQKYWIPFTTTVPGTGAYPDETVTLYARSLEAPPTYYQLRNVPELERKTRALEFVFRKGLSHGWQAAGSAVVSRAEGNIGGFLSATSALTEAADSPNYFINRTGRLDMDRPFQATLMAGVELPFRLLLSGVFSYQSGRPWQRGAYILPPADWCAANNAERTYYAVNLEASGSRREKAWSSLDLRLERTWPVGSSGRLGLYLDVANVLGYRSSIVGLNDVDRWLPAAEGAGQPGQKYIAADYGLTTALCGKRLFRFGLRLGF